MRTQAKEITWTSFRTRFLEKYFPDSAKHEREAEFLTFQHENLTVQTSLNIWRGSIRLRSPRSRGARDTRAG